MGPSRSWWRGPVVRAAAGRCSVGGRGAVLGQAAALRFGGRLAADCPAMRGLVARRATRFVRCVHDARTGTPDLLWMRAARAATSPRILGTSQARCRLPEHSAARSRPFVVAGGLARCASSRHPSNARTEFGRSSRHDAASQRGCFSPRIVTARAARQGVLGGGDFWGDEQHRVEGGARSALRQLTRGGCLSAVNEVNVASSAARPRPEQRSAAFAQRRPPQHEPPPNTPCRVTPPRKQAPHAIAPPQKQQRQHVRQTP